MSATYETWATALLNKLASDHGRLATAPLDRWQWLVAWAQLEATEARFNPLATTWFLPGSSVFNSADVRSYRSLEDGVHAVVDTLGRNAGPRGYSSIVDALLDPDSAFRAFRWAVSLSAWSGLPRDGEHYQIPDYDPAWAERELPGSSP